MVRYKNNNKYVFVYIFVFHSLFYLYIKWAVFISIIYLFLFLITAMKKVVAIKFRILKPTDSFWIGYVTNFDLALVTLHYQSLLLVVPLDGTQCQRAQKNLTYKFVLSSCALNILLILFVWFVWWELWGRTAVVKQGAGTGIHTKQHHLIFSKCSIRVQVVRPYSSTDMGTEEFP